MAHYCNTTLAGFTTILLALVGCTTTTPSAESEKATLAKSEEIGAQDAGRIVYDATLYQDGTARVQISASVKSQFANLTFTESSGADFSCISDIARICASTIPSLNHSGRRENGAEHAQAPRAKNTTVDYRVFTCNSTQSKRRGFSLPDDLKLPPDNIEAICTQFLPRETPHPTGMAYYRERVFVTVSTSQHVGLRSIISLHNTQFVGSASIRGEGAEGAIWPLGVNFSLACAYSSARWLDDIPYTQGGDVVWPRGYSLIYISDRLLEGMGIYVDTSSVPSNSMTNDDYLKFLEQTSTKDWNWRCHE